MQEMCILLKIGMKNRHYYSVRVVPVGRYLICMLSMKCNRKCVDVLRHSHGVLYTMLVYRTPWSQRTKRGGGVCMLILGWDGRPWTDQQRQ